MFKKLALAGALCCALASPALAQGPLDWLFPQPRACAAVAPIAHHSSKPKKPSKKPKATSSHRVGGAAPNWTTGYIPPTVEWKTLWASKIDEGEASAITASMLASGAAAGNLSSVLPNLSASVNASGVPGLNGASWYIYNSPSSWSGTPTFRSDRLATSGSAPTAGQANSWPWANIVAYNQTNSGNIGFETGVLGWFDANANASTNAQQVAGEFVIVKQRWIPMATATATSGTGSVATITFSGSSVIPVGHTVYVAGMTPSGYNGYYKVTASSAGSVSFASTTTGAMTVAGTVGDTSIAWAEGLNANCTDFTGEPDPIAGCVGAEFDVQTTSNTTDAYRQRVGVQIVGATGHIGRGILMSPKGGGTIDRAAEFDGAFGFGLDFTNGAFSGPVALLASNQTVAFDSNTSGVYARALGYNSVASALQYTISGAIGLSVSDAGVVAANGYTSTAGNNLALTASTGGVTQIGINGAADVWTFDASGFYPTNDNVRTLGSATYRWSTVYAANVGTASVPVSLLTATAINSDSGSNLSLTASASHLLSFGVNAVNDVYEMDVSGVHATADNARTSGTATYRWSNVFGAKVTTSALVVAGGAPTASGTCAINTQAGGNSIGSFKANGACAGGTIILTFATTAPTDWSCTAMDVTTPADTIRQSNTTASTTTATFTATLAASDLVRFQCFAF